MLRPLIGMTGRKCHACGVCRSSGTAVITDDVNPSRLPLTVTGYGPVPGLWCPGQRRAPAMAAPHCGHRPKHPAARWDKEQRPISVSACLSWPTHTAAAGCVPVTRCCWPPSPRGTPWLLTHSRWWTRRSGHTARCRAAKEASGDDREPCRAAGHLPAGCCGGGTGAAGADGPVSRGPGHRPARPPDGADLRRVRPGRRRGGVRQFKDNDKGLKTPLGRRVAIFLHNPDRVQLQQ
jgi:hypothetical protein